MLFLFDEDPTGWKQLILHLEYGEEHLWEIQDRTAELTELRGCQISRPVLRKMVSAW